MDWDLKKSDSFFGSMGAEDLLSRALMKHLRCTVYFQMH